jgi:hypothetical protein
MLPRIEHVVAEQLAGGNVVTPVSVLVDLGLLRPEHLADWRRGRVPYLERAINCNLSRLTRLLRILRFYAHDLNLKPSPTVYVQHCKGGPRKQLRFSRLATPTSKPPTRPTSSDLASELCWKLRRECEQHR